MPRLLTTIFRCIFWLLISAWTIALLTVLIRIKVLKWKPADGPRALMSIFVITFWIILAFMMLSLLLKIRLF